MFNVFLFLTNLSTLSHSCHIQSALTLDYGLYYDISEKVFCNKRYDLEFVYINITGYKTILNLQSYCGTHPE